MVYFLLLPIVLIWLQSQIAGFPPTTGSMHSEQAQSQSAMAVDSFFPFRAEFVVEMNEIHAHTHTDTHVHNGGARTVWCVNIKVFHRVTSSIILMISWNDKSHRKLL